MIRIKNLFRILLSIQVNQWLGAQYFMDYRFVA